MSSAAVNHNRIVLDAKFERLYRVNCGLASALGIGANCALAALVLGQRSELRRFSWVFLQNSVLDLVYSLAFLVLQPVGATEISRMRKFTSATHKERAVLAHACGEDFQRPLIFQSFFAMVIVYKNSMSYSLGSSDLASPKRLAIVNLWKFQKIPQINDC